MNTALIELISASLLYALGGLCMKLSSGLSKPAPAAMVFVLFLAGATLQTLGMDREDMGVAYILVLGLEAIAALLLSIFVLKETCSISRLLAVGVVIAGIVWLRHT